MSGRASGGPETDLLCHTMTIWVLNPKGEEGTADGNPPTVVRPSDPDG